MQEEALDIRRDDGAIAVTWSEPRGRYLFTLIALAGAIAIGIGWLEGGARVAFAAVSALLGYAVLVKLVNRTAVRATAERLQVSSRPLPWWSQTIAAADVRQIRCHPHPLAFRRHDRLALLAMTATGPVALLELDDEDPEIAAQLCRELAEMLGADADIASV